MSSGAEYIRLSPQELRYGQKAFLEGQLSLLNATKHCNQYKKLRKEEFTLKLALRKSAEEALVSLRFLQSLLPKTVLKEDKHHRKEVSSVVDERGLSLDQEINAIKQKLATLR